MSTRISIALWAVAFGAFTDQEAERTWLEQFAQQTLPVSVSGTCEGRIGALPEFTAIPPAPGRHLVRASLPFAPGALPAGLALEARCGSQTLAPGLRPLSFHPGAPPSIRRAMVTFDFVFTDTLPKRFTLRLTERQSEDSPVRFQCPTPDNPCTEVVFRGTGIQLTPDGVSLSYPEGVQWEGRFIGPARVSTELPVAELVESNPYYCWLRLLVPDPVWPRIFEVRIDALGKAAVQAHIQRRESGDATAPDLGWEIRGPLFMAPCEHSFCDGESFEMKTSTGAHLLEFPDAHCLRRGGVSITNTEHAGIALYLRCSSDENVPFQSMAWRNAAFAVGPSECGPLTPLLEASTEVDIPADAYSAAYGVAGAPDLSLWPVLDDLVQYTRDAVVASVRLGDDFGNVTQFVPGAPAPYSGMNRLNHAPPIFEDAWRTNCRALRDAAVLWCGNMFDLSIWWGDGEGFGGTRYNNIVAQGRPEHKDDTNFMWRSNDAVSFCTKGFSSFLYAYEETGDPRMAIALDAQVKYVGKYVHADRGECRNIGDVDDFMRLHRLTRVPAYREEAQRLFRELRTCLSEGDLFDQSGKPLEAGLPFIDDDAVGLKHGFAKPYIIGYALSGLPALLEEYPGEPKLRDVVRAVADFLASSQDPVGGWRYPHPRSSGTTLSQAIEHGAQLARAASVLESRGERVDGILDAVERILRARVNAFEKSGQILAALSGWEHNPGVLPEGKTIYDLYQRPEDRDPARDYDEGAVGLGGSPPEGLVYMTEVLQFYLAHRPAERLFHLNDAQQKVLARVPDGRLRLIPESDGPFLRIAAPDGKDVAVTLRGPNNIRFSTLPSGSETTPDKSVDWRRDASGAAWHTLEYEQGTVTACYVPRVDYVECSFTFWPVSGAACPETFSFEMRFKPRGPVSGTEATPPRDKLRLIHGTSTPDRERGQARLQPVGSPVMAVIELDDGWSAALVTESPDTLPVEDAGQIRLRTTIPLRRDCPVTARALVYLLRGGPAKLQAQYDRHVKRWRKTEPVPPAAVERTAEYGMREKLPVFSEARIRAMSFPGAWNDAAAPFQQWRRNARTAFLDTLGPRLPEAPFEVALLDTEDRGPYEARKIALNISACERIKAYLLVPKGSGPFPAILALHDHGAHFSIGKEKVVRPFDEPGTVVQDATEWVDRYYGGRWIGDELAGRGYVVFAADALFWGERGRAEGVEYSAQQELAANMLQLGLSWGGKIVWDDVRSAQFVQGLPMVSPERIGCIGLSMGANRTWHLTAATDIVQVGAAICWMCDTPTLMSEGNNQTKGQSAFSMIHPGLRNLLDYPDVAAIACPKPMLFYNGEFDTLFPLPGVEASYARMRLVWNGQDVADRLVTKIWPVPHVFSREMQEEALAWLDSWLKQGNAPYHRDSSCGDGKAPPDS